MRLCGSMLRRSAPLGLPGTSRVDDRGAEGGARKLHRLGPPAREEVVEMRRPVPSRLSQKDEVAHLARFRTDGLDHRKELIAHEHRHRVGVIEDVRDLLGHEAMVHGRGDETRRAGARARQQMLDGVGGVDDDMLVGAEPEADQGVAEAIPSLHELRPGPDAVALDQRGLVRMAGGVGTEDVHRARYVARRHRESHTET